MAAISSSADCKLPLWTVQRGSAGLVDEKAERRRCQLLVDEVKELTSGEGSRLRYKDVRFSFHDSAPPASADCARFLNSIAERRYKTPLLHDAWEQDLLRHPDRLKTALLLDTLRNGANICYDGERDQLILPRNHHLSDEDSLWLSTDFEKDLASGRVIGWFEAPPFVNLRCSPLAVVPKLDAGKRVGSRRILDCSAPEGASLNDFIQKLECKCIDFEAAVAMVADAGPGALLAKFDVDSAFRIVPVRVDDLHLLGFEHLGRFAFDSVCSFGTRTSPALWERVASALNFVLVRVDGVTRTAHWVDDFLCVWNSSEDAKSGFAAVLARCARLGIPVKLAKTVFPCTALTFAGFLFDTVKGTISITEDRRSFIMSVLEEARESKRLSMRQLQSVIGRLHFISRILPPGRGFVNRLLLSVRDNRGNRSVRVTPGIRADLDWWRRVLPEWSGVATIAKPVWSDAADIELFTDSCSDFGMGGVWGDEFFSEQWSGEDLASAFRFQRVSVPLLELRAIVRAAELWSGNWSGKRLRFRTDCLPVVFALNKGTTRMAAMADQLRTLSELAVLHQFEFCAVHVPGATNLIADALSRGFVQAALSLMAQRPRSRSTNASRPGPTRA